MITLLAHTLGLAIDEELNLIGTTEVAPHVDIVARHPVPVGEEVEHGLRGPLALVHVIGILGEACEIDDAKVAGARRESVGRRLTDIVEARPDILSSHEGVMLHHVPCLFVSARP